jgi:hypothetical protein
LERVEQTAGAPGADAVGGEALENLINCGKEGCGVGQGGKFEQLLLVTKAPRRDRTQAGVEVAKGRAA